MQLQLQDNSSSRWLVRTRRWIIEINSLGTIPTRFLFDFVQLQHKNKQTLKTVLKRTMSVYRPWTRHVCLCYHKFGQKNHTTTCLVRRIKTRWLCTLVRVDVWSFVRTHDKHDNPPTESLNLSSPCVSTTTFSRPLKLIRGLLVLETSMSVY